MRATHNTPPPNPGWPEGQRVVSYCEQFYAVPNGSDWLIYYTGYTASGELIGRIVDGKFCVNPETAVVIDPIDDTLELVALFMKILKRAAYLPFKPEHI